MQPPVYPKPPPEADPHERLRYAETCAVWYVAEGASHDAAARRSGLTAEHVRALMALPAERRRRLRAMGWVRR